MLSPAPQKVPTNLPLEYLVMDDREGGKDRRYYCLPPYCGNPQQMSKPRGGTAVYPYHLVSQGHHVGIFDDWLEAKVSLTGFPGSGNKGYHSIDECIEAWQNMCVLSIHPHPVDPKFVMVPSASAVCFVNTSPRKLKVKSALPLKHEAGGARAQGTAAQGTSLESGEDKAQVLADLKRFCSPIRSPPPSPTKTGQRAAPEGEAYINFAIRGDGIISSSPVRSQRRYLALQCQGEQPDMLVTRSFEQASIFALDDGEEAGK
ncbi:hypothetical protein B0H19DRAFT_1245893 [Mycena capillaripes]|nr:hypothetical protein B0H19DRAFT_1245893 [Mycena capillaripes]